MDIYVFLNLNIIITILQVYTLQCLSNRHFNERKLFLKDYSIVL
jgi:hypothetical protein